MGHEVVRLPPYHCQYNPIELIWAHVKSKVAEKNNTFKMADIEMLVNNALDAVYLILSRFDEGRFKRRNIGAYYYHN